MNYVTGILADIIRDNMADAETTLEDWQNALKMVEAD